jgi:hypothetical protein
MFIELRKGEMRMKQQLLENEIKELRGELNEAQAKFAYGVELQNIQGEMMTERWEALKGDDLFDYGILVSNVLDTTWKLFHESDAHDYAYITEMFMDSEKMIEIVNNSFI